MNLQNMKILRDTLALEATKPEPKLGFDLSTSFDERSCGSVACLMGWSATLAARGQLDKDFLAELDARDYYMIMHKTEMYQLGMNWLGVSDSDAHELFALHYSTYALEKTSVDNALEYLDACIEDESILSWQDFGLVVED